MEKRLLRQRDPAPIVAAVGISALGDFLLWVPLTLHLKVTTDSGACRRRHPAGSAPAAGDHCG
jgi:hypothetical protein